MTIDRKFSRILVVDDNLQNRRLVEAQLLSAGYLVILAESGERGVELFSTLDPDLILLDVMMPGGIDGFETCRRIREMESSEDTAIVYLTGLNDWETQERALGSGGDDFLIKPIGRAELLMRVNSLLRVRELRRGLRHGYELIRAQRDALIASQEHRRGLTAFLVHDMRNLLSGASMAADLVERDPAVTGTTREAVKDLTELVGTMQRMVADMLDVSKSDEGRLQACCVGGNIAEIIRRAQKSCARRAAASDVRLEVDVTVEGEWRVDPELVRRLFENLVSNAVKFSPPGGRVAVSASLDSGYLEFAVTDEGAGVPESQRKVVFERYARLGRDEAVPGIGLGLAFCRLVVDAHGGKIWIEDGDPHGAVFRVRLPAHKEVSEVGLDVAMSGDRPVSLLVVEDHAPTRHLVRVMLEPAGFYVETAEDIAAAGQILEAFRPDAVLLDLTIPPYYEPTESYHALRKFWSGPVVMWSGHSDVAVKTLLFEAGAVDFIVKGDLGKSELSDRLRRAALRRPTEAPAG